MERLEIAETVGRTIKACVRKWDGSELLVIFEDGTYLLLEVEPGYDPGEEEIVAGRLNVLQFGERALADAGLMTQEKAAEMRREHESAYAAAELERERQQYIRLKRRFET